MSVLERVPDGPWDVVVIGGGITGCAVARDAAARSLSVLLLEGRDLASGTSGRSTKLLHGGLRYLEHGHVGLVREALHERELTARLAPALATPLEFVLPVWPGVFPGRFAARIGVALYDLLGGRHTLSHGRGLQPDEVAAIAPQLLEGCRGGVGFGDRQTDDARLTVAIARDASRRGASFGLGIEVTGIDPAPPGLRLKCRREDGGTDEVRASCVVNATGPWADRIRALAGHPRPMLRTSRGAHLVLEGVSLGAALLLPGRRRGHRLFAIPWRGATLFGTTDVDDAGDPGRDDAETDDLRLLWDEARRLFPRAGLTRRNVLSSFTGVRPLIRQAGETLASSREHAVRDEHGLITIGGGKLTTWRTMAIATVDAVVRRLGRGGASPAVLAEEPLPGGLVDSPEIDEVISVEMPRHAEDVVFRRLPIGHDPRQIRRALPEVVARMSARLRWSATQARDEEARVLARVEAGDRRLDDALGSA